MKKEYSSPDMELFLVSFETILSSVLDVSKNESGTDDHNDDDNTEW